MKIDIFDVGHGACSFISTVNGKRLMIDCGYNRGPYWWPSIHFYGQTIDALILTNLDEDHVADFRDVITNLRIGCVVTNNTINAAQLCALKVDGMQAGVQSVHEFLGRNLANNGDVDVSPLRVSLFRNCFGAFRDTNNLSLVTFVEYGAFSIVYPGDLERPGWLELLKDSQFCDALRRVNVFVTSHHGRESGCCGEVFDVCYPDAFVISDKEVIHESQEVAGWYRSHCRGLNKILAYPWEPPETRRVFTTRNDGCISIEVDFNGGYVLRVKSPNQMLRAA